MSGLGYVGHDCGMSFLALGRLPVLLMERSFGKAMCLLSLCVSLSVLN
jgi:hypothetical protein